LRGSREHQHDDRMQASANAEHEYATGDQMPRLRANYEHT
jgi:hypothetical protein